MKKKIIVSGYSNSIHFYRWCGFLHDAGYDVEIISLIKNNPEYDYQKIYAFRDYSVSRGFLKKIKLLCRMVQAVFVMRRSDADCVNLHYVQFYILVLAFFINKKTILTCWGSDILIDYRNSNAIAKMLYNRTMKKAVLITCDSESVKTAILAGCPSIDPEKIKIVCWGIDTDLFVPPSKTEKNILRRKYKIPEHAIVLLSIRNVSSHYRIKNIISQFNKITGKHVYLLVRVSPSADIDYLDECKAESSCNKNIIYCETQIDYKGIPDLFKISDTSLHFPVSDAVPVSMLEGISCGNRIVAGREISSYDELAQIYNLKRIDLDELNDAFIRKIMDDKAGPDRDNIIQFHSLKVSVEKIKQYMDEII